MGAFERLQNYTSGLKPSTDSNNISVELEELNHIYASDTPIGYFLNSLHKLGFKVIEVGYTSGDNTLSEKAYNELSENEKATYKKGYHLTEFANMLMQDGDCLIISGAGSGKTTALTFKIMKDILSGEATKQVDIGGNTVTVVDDIFVGTFLKTGADELKASVEKWQRKMGYIVTTNRMQFGTLHAEFKRVLNAMGVKTPIGSADDIRKCLNKAIDSLGISRSDGHSLSFDDYAVIESIVCYYRNRLSSEKYQHPACEDYYLIPDILDKLVAYFAQERSNAGIMDFEDLQELLYKYLYVTPNKAVQDFVANRYKYIYIDEFQDTSEIQYAILKFYARGRLNCNKICDNLLKQSNGGTIFDDLYTGQVTRGKFVAIGDDDQCFVEGQRVFIDGGTANIEDIGVSDRILTAVGGDAVRNGKIESVSSRYYSGKTYIVTTSSGRRIQLTGNHICFARLNSMDNCLYLCYTMEDGFELSFTPYGERVWLIGKYTSFDELTCYYDEYLKDYEVLTLAPYRDNYAFGVKLLEDKGYSFERPHQWGNSPTFLRLTMMGNENDNTTIAYNSDTKRGIEILSKMLNRYDCTRGINTDIAFTLANAVKSAFKLEDDIIAIQYGIKLTNKHYNFVPASSLCTGLYVPVFNKGHISEEEIISIDIEDYTGKVYDINVKDTRNYVVDGVFCHNCIYSWRGSSLSVMLRDFTADFAPTTLKLSKNYRCPSNILNPILTSIARNTDRYPKELVSAREGGVFNAYHFVGLPLMLEHFMHQVEDDIKQGYNIAVICRTNFDGLIPALLLEMNKRHTFSISSQAMTLSYPLPRSILGVCRLFIDKSSPAVKSSLELLAGYDKNNVRKIMDKLKADASVGISSSIWTLDIKDINYTCPTLMPIISGVRGILSRPQISNESNEIEALKFLYSYMLTTVYAKNNSYCLRVRSYIEAILYLLKSKNYDSVSDFYSEVINCNERLKSRIKKDNTPISIVTVHEFKGKERDSVYVWHDSKDLFPANKTDLDNEVQVAEERRVHYIACTRARKKCTIYALRNSHGMFLDEMNCVPSDPTVISGKIEKNSNIDLSTSCSEESKKLEMNLSNFSFKIGDSAGLTNNLAGGGVDASSKDRGISDINAVNIQN